MNIAKSQAHEMLSSLCSIGLLRRGPRGRYRLGWGAVSLGGEMLRQEFQGAITPAVRRLAMRCGQTIDLVALDRAHLVVLSHTKGTHDTSGASGLREDTLHCTAAGKMLLAMETCDVVDAIVNERGLRSFTRHTLVHAAALHDVLSTARHRRVAFDGGELDEQRRAVAVPVFDHEVSCAVLSITCDASFWRSHEREYTTILTAEANRLSRRLAAARDMELAGGEPFPALVAVGA
jgi:DNA-binding IclR family transcriptional regulator